MNKKLIILSVCLLAVLVACQQKDGTGSSQNSEANTNNHQQNEENNTNDNETALSVPEAPLQKGDASDNVKSLQQVLAEVDYPIEETGSYDDLTTWAITDIQLQKDIPVSGIYDEDTEDIIAALLKDEETITAGEGLEKPSHPDEYPEDVENPYDVLALVNKSHALPGDYEPEDLVIPDVRFPYDEDIPKKYLREVAAVALEDLVAAGDDEGVAIFGQSGFRSYDRQEAIFATNAAENGEDHANTYSAKAGQSEHQTGLVMDVTAESVGFDLNTDFGKTDEGKWLKEHAHEHGFIIRYPEDKEDITAYQYEPWHLRYVGEKAATEIYENSETLEEYLDAE